MNTSCQWLRSLGFLFVLLALGPTAQVGAKVIEYTFDPPTPLNPTFESDGITGFGITKGVDTLTLQAPVNYGYPTDPGLRVVDITASGTVQDAIDKDMYFEFGFHIDDPGYSDILHGAIVSFDVGRGGGGTRGVGLASSVDNFSTLLLSDNVPTTRPIFTHYSTALTGSMFHGLSGDVTFRMYVYSPSAGSSLEFDNILIASPGEGMWFGGVDSNWSTAANWATGNVPASGSATTITLGNTEYKTSNHDLSEPFTLNRLNLVGVGQGISLSGGALRFVADGGTSPVLHHVPHASSTIANSVELATTTFAQIDAGGLTLEGGISGGGSLVKIGEGILTLSGENSFSGSVTVSEGVILSGNVAAFGAMGNEIVVESGGAIDFGGANTGHRDYAATISGAGPEGDGAIVNSVSNRNYGVTSLTLAADATIGGTRRWDIRPRTGRGSLDLAGFTLTKTGSNTIAVADGSITSEGTINIEQGILAITRTDVEGDGAINVSGTGRLRLESSTRNFSKAITLTDALLDVITTDATLGTGATIELIGTGTIDVQTDRTLYADGAVSGGNLTKAGGGTLVLNAENTYSGVTTINAGTIRVGSATALGSSSEGTVINEGGTLDLNGQSIQGEAINVAGTITNTGGLQMHALRNVTLSGNAVFTGTGRWDIRGGGGVLNLGGFTATKMGSNDVHVVDSTINGTGGITVDSGTLGLTRSTWNTGTLTVNAGGTGYFENNDGANHSYSMDIDVLGGTIRSFGGDTTVNSAIQLTGTTTFRPDNHSLRLNGLISGTGSLTKTHAGTLVLTGENTYEGGTTVSAGTLMVSNTSGSGTGSGPVSVNPAGSGSDPILGGAGAIAGTVTVHSGGMHAPGASVGEQTIGGAVWHSGGMFQFEINDTLGVAGGDPDGLGWDLVTIDDGAGTGKLDLRDLNKDEQFEIHIVSLDGASPGEAANFNPTVPYDWLFVTYDELVEDYFDPNLFAVNAGGFENGIGGGHFAVTQVPGGLAVSFIPEPGALIMVLSALALLLCPRRRCLVA